MFSHLGVSYALRVTDPRYERAYLARGDGRYAIGRCFLTISLGEPYDGWCYLTTADVASDGRIRFGILTNGSVWRLYDRRARPRASGFFEADLADLLQPGNEDGLRAFLLLFGSDSFTLQGTATTTFLEAALAEGRRYEESGRTGSIERGVRAGLSATGGGDRRRRRRRRGRQPVGSALGGAHLPVPAAVRAVRGGPRSVAGQRHPLRRLRPPAQAGTRGRGAPHGRAGTRSPLRPGTTTTA